MDGAAAPVPGSFVHQSATRHGSNRGSQLADLASAAALDASAPPRLLGRIRMDPAMYSIAVKSLLSASTRRARSFTASTRSPHSQSP